MAPARMGLIAALLAVAITGCSAVPSDVITKPTESAAPAPSVSIDPADPSTWIISADGIGPIALGQSLDEATLALSSFTEQDLGCDNPGVRLYTAPGAPTVALFLANTGPTVAGIRISDYEQRLPVGASPRTAEGLGLGSTVAEVQAEYADAVGEAAAGVPNYTHVVGDDIWISFANPSANESRILNIDVAHGGHMFYELCGF